MVFEKCKFILLFGLDPTRGLGLARLDRVVPTTSATILSSCSFLWARLDPAIWARLKWVQPIHVAWSLTQPSEHATYFHYCRTWIHILHVVDERRLTRGGREKKRRRLPSMEGVSLLLLVRRHGGRRKVLWWCGYLGEVERMGR